VNPNFKRTNKKPKKKKKESRVSGGDAKKPKGNGIKDSLCVACVYAVVFWFFILRCHAASHLSLLSFLFFYALP
jgi:hypothetical protein